MTALCWEDFASDIRGGFRGGRAGRAPPKIRKAYMLYNVI